MSDSKKTQGALVAIDDPRRLLAGLFEHAPTAFQIFSATGHSVLTNQAFRDLFGSEPPPEYSILEDSVVKENGFAELIQRAFAGETITLPVQWYDARDLRNVSVSQGRRVAVQVTLFPLYDGAGRVTHVAHCPKDVSAEQTLALERAEIDATLHSIGDAVIATDNTGRVVRMNAVAESLTGWSLKDAKGLPLSDIFRIYSEDTRQPLECPAARVLREGVTVGLANRTVLVSKAGTEYPIADSGAPIRSATGEMLGVVLVFRDKTEEDKAERALRESAALLRIASRAGRLGGWTLSFPSRRITWSDEVCAIHEVPPGTQPTFDETVAYYTTESRPLFTRAVSACVADGTPFDLELQFVTGKGRRLWVRAIGHASRNEQGETTEVHGALQEITEKKQTEAQLLVSDRMASIGTLAAGVAHEINNPLASVTANLALADHEVRSMAAKYPIAQDLLDEMRDARDAAERVRTIVRDLKIFSHAEEDRHGPVDVEQVLDSTMRIAWNQIRHLAKIVKVYGKVPTVHGNESRLGQVFLNLIINAAQAIPEGQFEDSEVRVETSVLSNHRVQVKISDTGAGIATEQQPRLFTPFWTTKPIGVGTGLGLSICHRLVTSMSGTIDFTSEVGKGTVFTVELPVSGLPAERLDVLQNRAGAVAVRRGRVLVIDDEVVIAHTVRRILGSEHDVVPVDSAERALALIRSGESFDILLCDVMMPQFTGMDLHAELMKMDPKIAARAVFMTGGAFTPKARDFLASISNPRIEKPFDVHGLRGLINGLMR
jgi:PAS domain S-box-containing protein